MAALRPNELHMATAGNATCPTGRWLADTAGNSAARRVVLVDGWRRTGVGHSIVGVAGAMQLLLLHHNESRRSVRTAFCIPRKLTRHYVFRAPMPLCRGSHFDLSHYIALDGVSNFVASGEDLAPGPGVLLLRSPRSCDEIARALSGPRCSQCICSAPRVPCRPQHSVETTPTYALVSAVFSCPQRSSAVLSCSPPALVSRVLSRDAPSTSRYSPPCSRHYLLFAPPQYLSF